MVKAMLVFTGESNNSLLHFLSIPNGIIIAYLYPMKKFLLPIMLLLSIMAFAYPQKKKIKRARQKETITQIVFETFTRRGRTEVTITKDSAISIGRTENKFMVMGKAEWNELVNTVKALQLSTLPSLASPTKQREVDGAAHCRIRLSTAAATYRSQYFDGGKPMKPLQALYNAIDAVRNHIEENGAAYGQ